MKNQKLELAIDSESLSIFRINNEEDNDVTHIIYYHEEEWLEDAESVVPAMLMAIDLFHRNPIELLKRLGLDELILN